MNKSEFIGFRLTEAERQRLEAIRQAANLPSLSEAARRLIRQADAGRQAEPAEVRPCEG